MSYRVALNTLEGRKTIDIPYSLDCPIWYCYKRFKKYVVRESRVKRYLGYKFSWDNVRQ